jgi:hypothetical protein
MTTPKRTLRTPNEEPEMTTHTPTYERATPWHVISHPTLPETCHGICQHGEDDFAGSFATIYNCDESLAHLIAAAPELLEALKLAEDVLARFPFTAEIWPNGTHANTGISQIRAAIAKAEGATP